MFISMCSGQEIDKLTGPDSTIKPKSQAQWHVLVTTVFGRQKQEDYFKFKASLLQIATKADEGQHSHAVILVFRRLGLEDQI